VELLGSFDCALLASRSSYSVHIRHFLFSILARSPRNGTIADTNHTEGTQQ
jgi:hypothetical protein